ncbi:hypothetical protein SPI_04484 [Niveomyces insectorum RCEF 264]|uniref:Uncharacterized protein n=1 Tax=Niveomyces insectorum RCEF 264 TaxID=1081102 RepID=A0A167UJ04_9HYPO|nr:hypothetical protein SPI_04484 [Niveomyces insectorum RCEF 264]
MLRLRTSKSRSEIAGSQSPIPQGGCAVHLQHINPVVARRDARVAASKAFELSQERRSADSSMAFPGPLSSPPLTFTQTLQPLKLDSGAGRSAGGSTQPRSTGLQYRHSIRFVRPTSSADDGEAETDRLCSAFPTASHGEAHVDSGELLGHQTAFRQGLVSDDDNHIASISSLRSTPGQRYNIHKTWSGARLRNKENLQNDEGDKTDVTRCVNSTVFPRQSIVNQRAQSGTLSPSSLQKPHVSKLPSECLSCPVKQNDTTLAPPSTQQLVDHLNKKSTAKQASAYSHHTTPARIRRSVPLSPSMLSKSELHGTTDERVQKHDQELGQTSTGTTGETAIPASSATTSKSFLKTQRRTSFSFSSNDDEQILAGLPHVSSLLAADPSRLQRQPDVRMRKSLRQSRSATSDSRPLTPKPSLSLPSNLDESNGTDEIGGGAGSSGTLRRKASKMSKAVKSRLKVLWSHSKSEDNAEQLPAQHIQARKSHGSLPEGHPFTSDSEAPLSAGGHTKSDSNDAGTIIRGGSGSGDGGEDGDRAQTESGGNTSRFTSWSNSVRQSSSSTSNHPPMTDADGQQLSTIAEKSNQFPPFLAPGKIGLSATKQPSDSGQAIPTSIYGQNTTANLPRRRPTNRYKFHDTTRKRSSATTGSLKPALTINPRQSGEGQNLDPDSPCSSSTSSPSLASSGRGATPRQEISPDALRRLQELSINLQNCCRASERFAERALRKKGTKSNASDDDPFYDGKKKEVLYAFPSVPTTPAKPEPEWSKTKQPEPPTISTTDDATPTEFLFRKTDPYRRALRASMQSFEEEAAAFRTRHRDRVVIGFDGATGDSDGEANTNDDNGDDDDDDDAPLLVPHGDRQWSRVQA